MQSTISVHTLVAFTPSFSEVITYTLEEEAKQLIELIAERIAMIYSEFLTAAGHEKRSADLKFYGPPTEFPTQEQVSEFKCILKATIIDRLTLGDPSAHPIINSLFRLINLEVDHIPEGALHDSIEKARINEQFWGKLLHFFPMKSKTSIEIRPQAKRIEISMSQHDRGAPSWPLQNE